MPRESCSRRRSAKPDSPPRRPTMRQRSALTTTCTPWRRSHVRSSKPFCGPRGRRISPTRSRIAPCGGDRPAGSLSSTGSRIDSSPKRRIWAGTRRSNGERRAGPVTTTIARSAVPTSSESGLRSSASSRALPHHQPASASAIPRAGNRHAGGNDDRARTLPPTAMQRHGHGRVPPEIGRGEPEAERRREQVRPRAEQPLQGAATSRSCSIRAGPIPGIASSSSSELNAPCFCR